MFNPWCSSQARSSLASQPSSAARSASSAVLVVFILAQSTWPSISLLQLAWLGSKITCVGLLIDSNWPLREESCRHKVLLSDVCSETRMCSVCACECACVCLPWWELCSLTMRAILQGKQSETATMESLATVCCFTHMCNVNDWESGKDVCVCVYTLKYNIW